MFSLVLVIFLILIIYIIFKIHKEKPWYERVIFIIHILFFPLVLPLVLGFQYNVAIDPFDSCYTPLGEYHIWSMVFYFIMYQISMYSLWKFGNKLPPLYAVLCLIFTMIGFVLNFILLKQISEHDKDSLLGLDSEEVIIALPTIILSFLIGFWLIIKMIILEHQKSTERTFKNEFLNKCNVFLSQRFSVSVWALLFLFPVLFITTLILMLFGQDYNSLVKVFTETTTWAFSQHSHPPPLDHTGHYLCTVSAKGSPKIVKPIRLGKRGGRTIIINRQLQIANAFEEMISDFSPKLHKFIRKNYDKYGYNLSKKINTERASNITYILMKPLEWFFLICLYLFVQNPEKKIKKQYQL